MAFEQQLMCAALGELEPGKVSVKAPVTRDAIQLLWFGDKEEFCILDLVIDPDSVSLKRKDGKDLQANVYLEDNATGFSLVLSEPVEEIVFRRLGRSSWTLEPEGLEIADMSGFEIFADSVAEHALIRQRNPEQN